MGQAAGQTQRNRLGGGGLSILFIFSKNQLLALLIFAMVSFVSFAFISALIFIIFFHQKKSNSKFQKVDIPVEKKCKKAKCLSGEALQIAVKRREVKSKGEKERYSNLNAELQRIARRDKKAFLSDQCKEIEENNRMRKTRDLQEN